MCVINFRTIFALRELAYDGVYVGRIRFCHRAFHNLGSIQVFVSERSQWEKINFNVFTHCVLHAYKVAEKNNI